MSYFDSLIFEELKNLNKNMEKLVHGVNVLAGIEVPGAINDIDFKVLARHIGPGIAGMSADEAKAAGWEKPVVDGMERSVFAEPVVDVMERSAFGEPVYNIEAILERADVSWCDDRINGYRVVTSMNPDAPLTESEQDILRRMWEAQGVRLPIVFNAAEGE